MMRSRGRWLLAGLGLAVLIAGGVVALRPTAEQRFARIQKQLAQGDLARGLAALRTYLDKHPNDPKANYLAGSILIRTAPSEAETYLKHVPATSPDRAAALRLLAALALERKDAEAARAYLNELQQRLPDDAAVLLGLVECHLLAGDPKQALPFAEKAVELAPQRAQSHLILGEILDTLGRVAESVEPFRRAVELDPSSLAARANLAYALHYVGDQPAALQHLKWCLARDPGNVDLLRIQAELARDMGDLAEARLIIESALKIRPDDLKGRLFLAELMLFENQPRETLAVLEPMAEKYPDHRHLTALLARAAWGAGETEKARRYQDRVREQIPARE